MEKESENYLRREKEKEAFLFPVEDHEYWNRPRKI